MANESERMSDGDNTTNTRRNTMTTAELAILVVYGMCLLLFMGSAGR